MLIVQKHLQAVTKALTGKEIAPIGEVLDKIKQLQAENRNLNELLKKVTQIGDLARSARAGRIKQALKG